MTTTTIQSGSSLTRNFCSAVLAMLTVSAVRGADNQAMPLTVLSVEHAPNEQKAEFALRNTGTLPVVAWVVEVAQVFADTSSERFLLTVDAYEDAAGLIERDNPYRNRVIRPGGTLVWTARLSQGSGREMSAVHVRPIAALLANNVLVGDRARARGLLFQRARDARALTELLSVLQSARAAHGDSTAALRGAVDALRVTETDHSATKFAYEDLRRTLDRAEQENVDPGDALSALLEQTRRRAAAATAAHVAVQSTFEPAGTK